MRIVTVDTGDVACHGIRTFPRLVRPISGRDRVETKFQEFRLQVFSRNITVVANQTNITLLGVAQKAGRVRCRVRPVAVLTAVFCDGRIR